MELIPDQWRNEYFKMNIIKTQCFLGSYVYHKGAVTKYILTKCSFSVHIEHWPLSLSVLVCWYMLFPRVDSVGITTMALNYKNAVESV